MTFTELLQWIDQGEGTNLEFKMEITHTSKIAKTICAFANTKGGTIVVGVADDGEIVGLTDPKRTIQKLKDAAMMSELPVVVQFDQLEINESLVVVAAYVPRSNNKPHHITDSKGQKRAYIRTRDKTMIANPIVQKSLQIETPESSSEEPDLDLDSKEKGLLKYLENREKITLKQYMSLVNISKRRARRSLVKLTLDGVLREIDASGENYYVLA
ncbi:MAG: putative DNA binding domain-containing protein [Chitinophagales bacterium]